MNIFIQKKIKIKIILSLCGVLFLLFPLNLYSEEPERILRKDSLALLDSIGQVKKSHILNSVAITGRKWAKISRYSALSMPLTTLDILTTPAALGDILGGLRIVPSAQTNDADGRLQVAGGRPEETETYMDGLLVSHSTSMGMNNQGVRSRFSPELFEDISLQAGGYSAASGHALSGLIDLKTNSLPTESKKLTLGISTTGLSLAKTFGCKQHRFYTKASYTDLTPYGWLLPDDYDWKRRYYQPDLEFSYNVQGTRWSTKMQALASLSGAQYAFYDIDNHRREQRMKEQYLFYQLNNELKITSSCRLSLAGNITSWRLRATDVLQSNDKAYTQDITSHSRLELRCQAKDAWSLRLGLDELYQKYRQTYTLGQEYQMSYDHHTLAGYSEMQYTSGGFTSTLGLRTEYRTAAHQWEFLPRLYLGWKSNHHLLALATGKYTQSAPSDFLKFIPHLTSSSAWNNSLSYSFLPQQDKYSVALFYKSYRHLPSYRKTASLPIFWEYTMNGESTIYGGNVFVKKVLGLWEVWASYALTLGEIRSYGLSERISLPDVATHSVKTTLKYWIPAFRLLCGASYSWDSGLSKVRGISVPPRSRLDVSLSYLPTPRVVLHLSVINALGTTNYWGIEYSDADPSRFRYKTTPAKAFLYLGAFITLSSNNRQHINPVRL